MVVLVRRHLDFACDIMALPHSCVWGQMLGFGKYIRGLSQGKKSWKLVTDLGKGREPMHTMTSDT